MKSILLVLISLGWITLYGQGHSPSFNPEDTIAFVNITLTNPDGTAYANHEVILKGQKGHRVVVTTNAKGYVRATVPFKEIYTVHCGKHTCMRKIEIGEFPYVTYTYQAYTRRFIYFTFTYQNPYGKRLEGEEVSLYSSTGKTYVDSTNKDGQVVFYLPFDGSFRIAVKYHDNVKTIYPKDVGKEYKILSTVFTWMGTKEKDRLAHIADSLARLAHLDATQLLDSLVAQGQQNKLVEEDIPIPIDYDSAAWVSEMLQLKASIYQSKLAQNPLFFETQNKAVLAPLYRLRKKFGKKIIVTDITGSMYGYMEQVMLWHALNFMENSSKKYLFFNDGDGKCTAQKKIGATGGFYFCQGQIKDFVTILNTMRKGMQNGGGGEYPENDIEALLAAKAQMDAVEELFLVADNYSPVRDLVLMKSLKIPVRIILCGVEDGGSAFWGKREKVINEEYLDLARATGGSIHLIKQDVYNLANLKEGESILLNGRQFDLINGRFILQEKL